MNSYLTSTYSTAWHTVVSQSLSRVQLFETPWTVACQAPLSMGFFQARILEWVAMPFSRRFSGRRDQTRISYVSCIGRQVLYHCTPITVLHTHTHTYLRLIWIVMQQKPTQHCKTITFQSKILGKDKDSNKTSLKCPSSEHCNICIL